MGVEKKKLSLIGLSAILLVAVVGSVTYGISQKNTNDLEGDGEVTTSAKAIKAICEPTSYKDTCESSLASANTSDPRELVKIAFNTTAQDIEQAIKNSTVLQEAAKDPMVSQALDVCKEVLKRAIKDINSSIDKIGAIDLFSDLNKEVGDLRTLTGSAVTFHSTCLDAFQNTTGDFGEKMKKFLKTAGELSSNGLAMVSSLNQILGQSAVQGTASRKLLQDGTDGYPGFVDATSRRLLADGASLPRPNAVVAQDGTGQFKSINEAIKTVPPNSDVPFVILVKAGIYKEYVTVPFQATRVVLVGEGPTKTKITGNKNYVDGVQTYFTATVAVDGKNFIARDIGFENSAGPNKHQAVALRVTADNAVFQNCQIDGYQDTLLVMAYRQFYRDCTISGTIDFVFGDAQSVFQNCTIVVRKPALGQSCMVTAQGRTDINGPGAIIIQNSKIIPDPKLSGVTPPVKAYLGRPWKKYSRTIIMNSSIDGFIAPEGWAPWAGNYGLDTLYYGEYQNTGPGADTSKRVTWKGIKKITPEIAEIFTPAKYYQGDDAWIKEANVGYDPGFGSATA